MGSQFKRGSRVEWTHLGETKYGVVDRVLNNGQVHGHVLVVIHDGGEYQTKASASAFSLSTKPLASPFKKGDRVQWADITTKELKHGTVQRVCIGGMSVDVMLDGGQYAAHRMPAGICSVSTKVLPVDAPSPMDAYGVSGYREIKGHGDSATFSCAITCKGVVIGEAMNDGWGGPDEYTFKDGYRGSASGKAFFTAAKAWWLAMGGSEDTCSECEDLWIDWYVNQRPYAVTAAQYVGEFCKDLAGMGR